MHVHTITGYILSIITIIVLTACIQYGAHLNHLTWIFQLFFLLYLCSWVVGKGHTTIISFIAFNALVAVGVCIESFTCSSTQRWLDTYGVFVFGIVNCVLHYNPILLVLSFFLPDRVPVCPYTQLWITGLVVIIYITLGDVNNAYGCNQQRHIIILAAITFIIILCIIYKILHIHIDRILVSHLTHG